MATYSLAITGARADQTAGAPPEILILPDNAGLPGATARAMQLNTPLLCKGSDGQLRYYTLDAERSTPTVPILKPL